MVTPAGFGFATAQPGFSQRFWVAARSASSAAWTAPWSGEIPLTRSDGLLYEYACHEGNRGMENILSAARRDIKGASGK